MGGRRDEEREGNAVNVRLRLAEISGRIGHEALAFGALRGLTLIAGIVALLIVPLSPEHQLHLAPLLAAFVAYNAALLAVLARWPEEARAIFLATLAADLALVFLLVWFTGGSGSHFYLLFYLLVTVNAYYFGPGIGLLAAALAAALLAAANWLALATESWSHLGGRATVLGILALALGHVAARERAARARVERLNVEMDAAMASLARAEQLAAVGRLSAKVAHEIRSPLGAISLNVDVLGEVIREPGEAAATEAAEILQGIRDEVRALTELTEEYLIAARLPSPRPEKDSLNDLVLELVAFLRALAARQGVTITVEADPALPVFSFDRAMMRQALRNLIKNSLEVLPGGGHIYVRTAVRDEGMLITVADDGRGIEPAVAERLSEPFFTTKPGGTGLGLSITDQIIRQHGGELRWGSRPGGGAEFTIRLPLGASVDA